MAVQVSSALVQLPTKPHALYRFFDRTDVLLYVGITMDLPGRVSSHRRGKPWWTEVNHITIEHFDTRAGALEAEAEAIRTEGPLYNDVHNQKVSLGLSPSADEDIRSSCGDNCDEECRDRHGNERWAGRSDLAICVIDSLLESHSVDERLDEARATAEADLRKPQNERTYHGEDDVVVITALELAETAATDLWRFRYVVENLLKGLPPGLVAHCEGAAAADWYTAGQSEAHRLDQLPDIVRHLGHALNEHFHVPGNDGRGDVA